MIAHFIGIGGIGMSALARALLDEGWTVTGSDLRGSSLTDGLATRGARIYVGPHRAEQLGMPDLVVITAAVRPDNPELRAAQAAGKEVLKRSELLGRLMSSKRGVAIAGTHGKTTTTALTGLALLRCGLDPTVFVGGEVPELGGNVRQGGGDCFVAEADEFDGSFLHLAPEVAVVTNVEPEHLDFYGDFPALVAAFDQFLQQVPEDGRVVYCLDDPVLSGLSGTRGPGGSEETPRLSPSRLRTSELISYGFHAEAAWRATDALPNAAGGTDYRVLHDGRLFGVFSLRVPGLHNVSNSLAAIAVGERFGAKAQDLQDAIAEFGGVKRRFQVLGLEGGVTVVDDYAHHPTEVRATLAAARARFPGRRICCLFQPHTYSRTRMLMDLFLEAFGDADRVWITDIYAAREDNLWGVSGEELAGAVRHSWATYGGDLRRATDLAVKDLREGDVLLLMGAGDVYTAGPAVLAALARRGRREPDAGGGPSNGGGG